jgi:hypothetical protein
MKLRMKRRVGCKLLALLGFELGQGSCKSVASLQILCIRITHSFVSLCYVIYIWLS